MNISKLVKQQQLSDIVAKATGASSVTFVDVIQTLWSGYGEIVRFHLRGSDFSSVVLKHVVFPSEVNHPHGWHFDVAHQRKVKSYEVEMAWYQYWAQRCDQSCRVPHCFSVQTVGDEHLMVLEDLDDAGFPLRKSHLHQSEAKLCLAWLAHFHATFMGESPNYLWPVGTYWHLQTRPEEFQAIADERVRDAAGLLDAHLNQCRFQTLVHGDAKVANFCFAVDYPSVAAVDFQYVGGGCGMKDVAYLLGSCFNDDEQQRFEKEMLNYYFEALKVALNEKQPAIDFVALEQEWRSLFAVAQSDFYRFLVGWMPTHWKINDYNKRVALRTIARLSINQNGLK